MLHEDPSRGGTRHQCPEEQAHAQGTQNLAPYVAGLRHDWSGRYSDAHRAFDDGQIDEAQDALETLSRERPDWPQAHHWIGRCHRQRGEMNEAVACYRKALRLFRSDGQKTLPPFAAEILSDTWALPTRNAETSTAPRSASSGRSPSGPTIRKPWGPPPPSYPEMRASSWTR
ncbi:MAG: tetratricopeptide repeat protein [Planctomycetes bacterium]|nr:tetratricopeptide repeat protein [Planctomycetota bacterium]